MTAEESKRVQALFDAALQRDPEERDGFLDGACSGRPSLRAAVASLLAAHKAKGNLTEAPALQTSADVAGRGEAHEGRTVGPYIIRHEIGRGGMGVVYLADDIRLSRRVALKALPPSLGREIGVRERLRQEARAAAALSHPGIATVYALEEIGGELYLACEYVQGQTLRALIEAGPVPSRQLIDLATQLAKALASAHAQGIVHRDLKPENVMIAHEGLAKIVDFGLAELALTDLSRSLTSSAGTLPGMVMGTVGYMSPEQASGRSVDHRSDQFTLGLIVYEMATGNRPFKRDTAAQTLAATIDEDPTPIRELNPEVPERLAMVVDRCLAKDPRGRYDSTRDLARDLGQIAERTGTRITTGSAGSTRHRARWTAGIAGIAAGRSSVAKSAIWIAVALGIALTAGAAFFYLRSPGEQINSMAVLPFVNSSGNPDTEYLTDGITETLINSLSQVPGLQVRARSLAFRYKGKDVDPLKAGQDLNVRAVITGRVSTRGNMLIIQSDLVDVSTGSQLWGNQYNRPLADIMAVQDEIATEIFETLRLRLTGEDKKRATKRYTENAEAYQLYLRGRYYWNQGTIGGFKKAIEYFQQAIDKDPRYALAHAGLADSNLFLGSYWVEALSEAKVAALKALELDRNLAEAHVALGHIKLWLDWDWPAAEREFKQGIDLNPSSALAHNQYAMYLAAMGRLDDAITEVRRAQELDALSPIVNTDLGWYLLYAGRGSEAVEQFRRTLDLDANYLAARWGLGASYAQQQLYNESIDELKKAVTLSEGSPVPMGHLGYAYGLKGATADARKTLADLNTMADRQYVPASAVALVYAGLGEKTQALDSLERAYREHDFAMVFLDVAPWFKSLRTEPRFEQLLRRMQLPVRTTP